jgi:hypothetical protein
MYGNKTVAVYKNSVKFSTAVTNWEFNAASNRVRYTIFMGSQGSGGSQVPGFHESFISPNICIYSAVTFLAGVDSSNANQQCRPLPGRPCAGGRRIVFQNSFLDLPSTALAGPGCSIDTPLGGPTCSEFTVTPTLVTNGNQQVQWLLRCVPFAQPLVTHQCSRSRSSSHLAALAAALARQEIITIQWSPRARRLTLSSAPPQLSLQYWLCCSSDTLQAH